MPAPAPAPVVPTIRFVDGSEIELIGPVVIGRDPSAVAEHPSASMHSVSDPTVSKTHVVVGRTGDDVWVLDHHSSNGVFVGTSSTPGDRIPAGRRVALAAGSIVSIGDVTSFRVGGPTPW
jgi:pSer/pThr/pTyr-binding forkhead associated (FHA) protein